MPIPQTLRDELHSRLCNHRNCPLCGGSDWAVGAELVELSIKAGATVNCVVIWCKRCKEVHLFPADQIGAPPDLVGFVRLTAL